MIIIIGMIDTYNGSVVQITETRRLWTIFYIRATADHPYACLCSRGGYQCGEGSEVNEGFQRFDGPECIQSHEIRMLWQLGHSMIALMSRAGTGDSMD